MPESESEDVDRIRGPWHRSPSTSTELLRKYLLPANDLSYKIIHKLK